MWFKLKPAEHKPSQTRDKHTIVSQIICRSLAIDNRLQGAFDENIDWFIDLMLLTGRWEQQMTFDITTALVIIKKSNFSFVFQSRIK